ncbi:MAG: hypothetical protein QOE31_3123, partial [Solirubrobacteraceae bacterium]|nr:hypothetical protein [Solirubrobacteraceae bacterium]
MSNEPPVGPEPGSGRLWTDPREAEEHTPWLEPRRRVVPRATPLPSTLPPSHDDPDDDRGDAVLRRRRVLGVVVGTLLAALLVGAGVLGASLLRDDAG